ncbi:hypothetical protein HDU93_008791 [Gonapodya sp. JEL0774]|nr:hypothetical protein HDU93_008791 [Gonapodya sp. JEL0774]
MSEPASQKTILVTGGCGYIGTHTVVELLEQNFDVVIVDDLRCGLESNSTTESTNRAEQITGKKILAFYELNVCDSDGLRNVFKQHKISAVIHFAGLKSVSESVSQPLKYFHGNVGGMVSLMSVMREFSVFNLVFSSSATVYGHPTQLPIPESHPVAPTNPYGRSKLMCEDVARDVCKSEPRFKVALLRYFNPIGAHASGLIGEDPNDIPNNLLPFITQVLVGRLPQLRVFGSDYETRDGTGVRDFIHVVDLALGHLAALKFLVDEAGKREDNCFTWNMGRGKGFSVLEVVKAMEQAAGKPVPLAMAPRRPGDCGEVVANPSLANSDLKWVANRSIDEMVASAWLFQRNHPEGYATKKRTHAKQASVRSDRAISPGYHDSAYSGSPDSLGGKSGELTNHSGELMKAKRHSPDLLEHPRPITLKNVVSLVDLK